MLHLFKINQTHSTFFFKKKNHKLNYYFFLKNIHVTFFLCTLFKKKFIKQLNAKMIK